MITQLGKELRKLRLDLGITLFEMAQQIGVSSSLLSSVETGKKPATAALLTKLYDRYEEVRLRWEQFQALADQTQSEVTLRLEGNESPRAKELAFAFARKFDDLSAEQIDSIFSVFNRRS